MRIVISIEHPAWAHQFKYVIKELEKRGHVVKVVAIDKDRDLELLDKFDIQYSVVARTLGNNLREKILLMFVISFRIMRVCRQFKPDLFIGRGSPMMALNSFIFRKPHVVFEDTEAVTLSLLFTRMFTTHIVTPTAFQKNLGRRHVRVEAFKELFYLHPAYFTPNASVLRESGYNDGMVYFVLRLVKWNAEHDFGQKGLSGEGKLVLIKLLKSYGEIIISSEDKLPEELEKYRMKLDITKMHDLLHYATMYIGESPTMATEATILGTPAVLVCSWAKKAGNMIELENKWGLMYTFDDERAAFKKIQELLRNKNLKMNWLEKRNAMVKNKIDINQYMLRLIESAGAPSGQWWM